MSAAALVPFSGAAVVTATIVICYNLTKQAGRFPPGVSFPPISALGVAAPEKQVYQLGFTLTGLLLIATVFLFRRIMLPHIVFGRTEDERQVAISTINAALQSGLTMASGVILQGLFTLELKVSLQSIIHWSGALIFVWGAMRHCETASSLYAESVEKFQSPLLQTGPMRLSMKFKRMCMQAPMFLFVLPLLFQVLAARQSRSDHSQISGVLPAPPPQLVEDLTRLPEAEIRRRLVELEVPGIEGNDFNKKSLAYVLAAHIGEQQRAGGPLENGMGLMQWFLVGSFVLYFATYTIDFFLAGANTSHPHQE